MATEKVPNINARFTSTIEKGRDVASLRADNELIKDAGPSFQSSREKGREKLDLMTILCDPGV